MIEVVGFSDNGGASGIDVLAPSGRVAGDLMIAMYAVNAPPNDGWTAFFTGGFGDSPNISWRVATNTSADDLTSIGPIELAVLTLRGWKPQSDGTPWYAKNRNNSISAGPGDEVTIPSMAHAAPDPYLLGVYFVIDPTTGGGADPTGAVKLAEGGSSHMSVDFFGRKDPGSPTDPMSYVPIVGFSGGHTAGYKGIVLAEDTSLGLTMMPG